MAYLDPDHNESFHVYGFKGNHLEWFIDRIVYIHEGDTMEFKEGAISMYTNYKPYKGYQKVRSVTLVSRIRAVHPLFEQHLVQHAPEPFPGQGPRLIRP